MSQWCGAVLLTSHVSHIDESCLTYAWVMSHTCMSHISHMYESFLTCMGRVIHAWVMSHTCMSHVSHMLYSRRAMPHTWMSHVTCIIEVASRAVQRSHIHIDTSYFLYFWTHTYLFSCFIFVCTFISVCRNFLHSHICISHLFPYTSKIHIEIWNVNVYMTGVASRAVDGGVPLRIAFLTWESLHTIAVGGVAPHVTELAAGMYEHIHICIFIYIFVYSYTFLYIFVYSYIFIYIAYNCRRRCGTACHRISRGYLHAYTHLYIHIHICIFMYILKHICVFIHIHVRCTRLSSEVWHRLSQN